MRKDAVVIGMMALILIVAVAANSRGITGKVGSPSCTDTDNGANYDLYGDLYAKGVHYADYCADKYNLYEYRCDNSNAERMPLYNCAARGRICVNGACEVPCQDSDGGKHVLEKGTVTAKDGRTYTDECLSRYAVEEAYCDQDNNAVVTVVECPSKTVCDHGVCV